MTTEITRIKQSDGSVRVIHAQDAEHAARARTILRNDPAMVDRLDGVDGIETHWVSAMGLDPTPRVEQKITITMSESRPLKVVEADWPKIASAEWHDNTHRSQANHVAYIRVRQHEDGRAIVYGGYIEGPGGVHRGFRPMRAGWLLSAPASDAEIIRAIRRVAGVIDRPDLAANCIADLPAEDATTPAATVESRGEVSIPREGALRLLELLARVEQDGVGLELTAELRAVASELRTALSR